jgi:putative flavoprotein involved in K+ transport
MIGTAAGSPDRLDALVVGAGPAGLGTALALDAVEGLTYGVVDAGAIGQTFLDWPEHQTMLTPSFTGNGFGATDLNAIHPRTSPAFTLGTDYPTGPEYARYLRSVAAAFRLPVLEQTRVLAVEPDDDGFAVETTRGQVRTRSLVWAAGEFAEPRPPRVAGAGLTDHSSTAAAWAHRDGLVVVLGGGESGIDIAAHHVEAGSEVVVADAAAPWDGGTTSDPSFRLAPRSRRRLDAALRTGRLRLVAAGATRIRPDGSGAGTGIAVSLDDGTVLRSGSRPIAATGFGAGLGAIADLVARRPDGWPALDEDDGSTIAPGLHLAGPAVRHGAMRFCFVYKFRQRFAHVARVIGERRGLDCTALEAWRDAGMLTDDLSCCGVECVC